MKQAVRKLALRLLVLIMNSLARWGAGWGSRGLITMLLSRGSPGTILEDDHNRDAFSFQPSTRNKTNAFEPRLRFTSELV